MVASEYRNRNIRNRLSTLLNTKYTCERNLFKGIIKDKGCVYDIILGYMISFFSFKLDHILWRLINT